MFSESPEVLPASRIKLEMAIGIREFVIFYIIVLPPMKSKWKMGQAFCRVMRSGLRARLMAVS